MAVVYDFFNFSPLGSHLALSLSHVSIHRARVLGRPLGFPRVTGYLIVNIGPCDLRWVLPGRTYDQIEGCKTINKNTRHTTG